VSAPLRICLIDDDASAREALERVLIGEGYEVISYPDGNRGQAAALEEDFDCVLTDLRMPGVSGLELIDTLRDELPNLPVVLMTAHGTTETAIEATRRGAFDYIVKPFEMEELFPPAPAGAAGKKSRWVRSRRARFRSSDKDAPCRPFTGRSGGWPTSPFRS
jgi:DNA-binding NtrC family response regulator